MKKDISIEDQYILNKRQSIRLGCIQIYRQNKPKIDITVKNFRFTLLVFQTIKCRSRFYLETTYRNRATAVIQS